MQACLSVHKAITERSTRSFFIQCAGLQNIPIFVFDEIKPSNEIPFSSTIVQMCFAYNKVDSNGRWEEWFSLVVRSFLL